jgi:hypothetical protein
MTYGCAASLFIGKGIIKSSIGVQQGDPLGPLLFAVALQPLLMKIKDLGVDVAAYLDDFTICCESPEIAMRCWRKKDHV